jgi:DoxX-like family
MQKGDAVPGRRPILLGSAVLVCRFSRTALIAMLAISLGYVAAAALAIPHLLVDPLGSILKIFVTTQVVLDSSRKAQGFGEV